MKTLSKLHIDAIEKAKDDLGKVNAAALAMIETPMDLIKAVLLKHEVAVIEVMCELHQQQQADEALLRQALEALEFSDWYTRAKAKSTIAALRERLAETADDLARCPNCGGPADNGHDREVPPNPYWCSKCTES